MIAVQLNAILNAERNDEAKFLERNAKRKGNDDLFLNAIVYEAFKISVKFGIFLHLI